MDMFTSGYSTRASRSTQERLTVSVIHNMISMHIHTQIIYRKLHHTGTPAASCRSETRGVRVRTDDLGRENILQEYSILLSTETASGFFFFLYLNTC